MTTQASAGGDCWLEVLDPGPLTTVQDGGRPGLAHLGVPPSGVLDRPSAGLANRLVGNLDTAAMLETTIRGPQLRVCGPARAAVVLAVTGAAAEVRVDDCIAGLNTALRVRVGQALSVGAALRGIRNYIAVKGGLRVEAVLDSRSTDLLSGLGPPPLRRGDTLGIGADTGRPPAAVEVVPVRDVDRVAVLRLVPGPRDDWFEPDALAVLAASPWTVSAQSNRIGIRLQGPQLTRRNRGRLPPEGIITGSLQVPPDGQPVLFLNDHPTTGGYPVIGVVTEDSLSRAAQAAPGTSVSFILHRPRLRLAAPVVTGEGA